MSKYKDRLLLFGASLLLFSGFVWLFSAVFFPQRGLWRYLLIGAAVMLIGNFTQGKRKWLWPLLWLAAVMAGWLLFRIPFADGMAETFNAVMDAYKRAYPKIYDVFTVTNTRHLPYFLLPVSALSALGCQWVVERQARCICLPLLLLLSLCIAVFLPILSSVQIVVAGLLCLFLAVLTLNGGKLAAGFSAGTAFVGVWLRTAAVSLLILLLLLGLFGSERPAFVVRSEKQFCQAVDAWRYGGREGTGLTEGDLSCVGPRQNGKAPLLKVTMSVPGSCYLRGFVGEVYENSRWSTLPNMVLYENADRFAFLHQNGFYAPTQLSLADGMTGKEQSYKPTLLQIENIGLPSKYLYVPYGMTEGSVVLDPRAIGDSTVRSSGFHGIRTYSVTGDSSLVLNYQKTVACLQEMTEETAVKEYRGCEAVYNRFVYEQYLRLPADVDAYLADKLGNYDRQDGQPHFDYAAAKQNILYYLTETVSYDETVPQTEEDVDFILNFLDGTKRGYDIHYASAAVMMFRYYGIPARFAEGYIVTGAEAKRAQSGTAMALDSSHAHAWAEYYRDGIGWLPFEATPVYLSVMDQPETYRDMAGLTGQTGENEHTEAWQPEEPEVNKSPMLLSFWLKNRLTIVLSLAVSAAVLLALLFVLWILRERRKTAARKALFFSEDRCLAVCTAFDYIIDLLVADGLVTDTRPAEEYVGFLDGDLQESYRAAVAIWQEALFSRNELTEKQRGAMVALRDELWRRLWTRAGIFQKIRIKFMYFL